MSGDPAGEALERGDVDAAVALIAAEVRERSAAGDARGAAMACARLGEVYGSMLWNPTASRAWFARAARTLAAEPPCVEQGWVAVASMGCDVADTSELLAAAELALDRARRFGDVDLETKALADGGLALVQAGRVAEGMAMLDEAMALACGGVRDDVAGKSACSMFTACYVAADFGRAASWAEALRRRGLVGSAPGVQAFLSSHCDSVQAALLVELGRWGDAESLLLRAKADFEAAMGAPSFHPAIGLVELRLLQGRLSEAEALLAGASGFPQALLPAARIHLARGDAELARAVAARGLRASGDDRLRAADLLSVLVEAAVAAGDGAEAERRCAELTARTDGVDVPAVLARAALARAAVLEAAGQPGDASRVLEAAVDGLDPRAVPWARVRLQLALARVREGTGERAAALVEAEAARAALAQLDIVLGPADRAVLDRLAPPGPRSPAPATAILARSGSGWTVTAGATVARLPASKGVGYLAELLAGPGREHHALDLVDRLEGAAPAGGPDRHRLGDAGPLLDGAARTAYRRRMEALRAEIDEALARADDRAAMAAQDEVDRLSAELARAFGLDGRGRVAGSAAERARLNVTRALRTSIARIAELVPEGGGDLDRSVRTGLYCTYEPPADAVRWIVQREVNSRRGP